MTVVPRFPSTVGPICNNQTPPDTCGVHVKRRRLAYDVQSTPSIFLSVMLFFRNPRPVSIIRLESNADPTIKTDRIRVSLRHELNDSTIETLGSAIPIQPLNVNRIVPNHQIRLCWAALLHCVDLCLLFQELEISVQDHNTVFFPCRTCPFRWSHLARMKRNHLCLQTGMAVAAKSSVSQAATPTISAICAALSAQMLPLAPLKVADRTG